MARQNIMQGVTRWHIRLAWLAAIPLFLWTVSGLFMTLRPIEEVRGENLRKPPALLQTSNLSAPRVAVPVKRLVLSEQLGSPVWLATDSKGNALRFAADGMPIAPVGEAEARELALAAYGGTEPLETIRRFPADAPPIDLRRPRPSWQATFADGAHVYIDADSGEVLAFRTQYWRIYDLMWGLHIMDPLEREDTSHALLWIFGAIGIVSTVLGTTLLFRRRRWARK